MPAKTPKMRRAAGAELGRRRAGVKKSSRSKRPFANISTKKLRHFARKKR